MNKRKIFRSAGILLAACTLFAGVTSCEKENEYTSVMPVFSGLFVSKPAASPNDSITFEARQQEPGKLIYKATYKWSVYSQGGSEPVYETSRNVVYDKDPSNPVCGYRIPADASGTYTMKFSATYHYSGQGTMLQGGLRPGSDGAIRPTSSGTLYGTSEGEISFRVE